MLSLFYLILIFGIIVGAHWFWTRLNRKFSVWWMQNGGSEPDNWWICEAEYWFGWLRYGSARILYFRDPEALDDWEKKYLASGAVPSWSDSRRIVLTRIKFRKSMQSKPDGVVYDESTPRSNHMTKPKAGYPIKPKPVKRKRKKPVRKKPTVKKTSEQSPQKSRRRQPVMKSSRRKPLPKRKKSGAMEELDSLIGLDSVKKQMQKVTNVIELQEKRKDRGLKVEGRSNHLVFTGNPGTGKTTVARIVGQIFKELRVLKKGHVVEVSRKDLSSTTWGSGNEKTGKAIEKALDGILFIDEAYALHKGYADDRGDPLGDEIVTTLLAEMENNRERLIVIAAGYKKETEKFMDTNPGLSSRFKTFIHFPDYTSDALFEIFELQCDKNEYVLSDEARVAAKKVIENIYEQRDEHFGNGRAMRNYFEDCQERHAKRLADGSPSDDELMTFEVNDIVDEVDGMDLSDKAMIDAQLDGENGPFEELDSLIGLASVKAEVRSMAALVKVNRARKDQGLEAGEYSSHMIFTGNPGTGKTTVARIVARIYRDLGVIKKGHMIEKTRKDMKGRYTGDGTKYMNEAIKEALDGVLFLDELYDFYHKNAASEDTVGLEAVNTLLTGLEKYRNRLVVIGAGYNEPIKEFLKTNPGLPSRFKTFIHFPDYKPSELFEIFTLFCKNNDYAMTQNASKAVKEALVKIYDQRDEHFGNGREVRNFFEECKKRHAGRLALATATPSPEELVTLKVCDIPTEYRGIDMSQIVKENNEQNNEIEQLEEEQAELERRLSELGGKNEHGSEGSVKDKQKKTRE